MYEKLNINNQKDLDKINKIGVALASPIRIAILSQLRISDMSVSELAEKNFISVSSIMFHLKLLKEANLVNIVNIETKRGTKRIINRSCFGINIDLRLGLGNGEEYKIHRYFDSLPVGCYINANLGNKSAIVTKEKNFLLYDDGPFVSKRFEAELLYTNYGFVEYGFNNGKVKNKKVKEIMFTLEICSESPYYNNDFKSDIIFSINNVELCTYTSPGDFGGRRGKYTPIFWSINSSQYGLLKNILVNEQGVFLDNILVNDKINIDNLKINKDNNIKFKIESKKESKNCGGFNIFGKNFGDYNQDIEMTIVYEDY